MSGDLIECESGLLPVGSAVLCLDLVEAVFQQALATRSLFKRREILLPDYEPDCILHRDEELRAFAQILAPALRGDRILNAMLFGLPGTGKTVVARYVLRRFASVARAQDRSVRVLYVNCRVEGSEYKVLVAMCRELGVDVPSTGLAKAELYARLFRAVDARGGAVIAVLDEVDAVYRPGESQLLYLLTRMNESTRRGKLSLTIISNSVTFKELMDARERSALFEEEILFHPYTFEQLYDILKHRAELAFHEGVVPEETLRYCAAIAAKEHGDARRALHLLRVAGELADRAGAPQVTPQHVDAAIAAIDRQVVRSALASLPIHAKLVLLAVARLCYQRGSDPTSGEVFAYYARLCRERRLRPRNERTFRSIVANLDLYGLVTARLESRGRYGRTRRIHALVTPEEVEAALCSER